jgi:oxygen-independent coproporphyrinogen-3 oxidase
VLASPEIPLERLEALLPRYLTAGPRYTSYPTAPIWTEAYGEAQLRAALAERPAAPAEGIALYAHVPFCRSLCHFCACNRVITRDPARPAAYLDTIEREIALVREARGGRPEAVQLHWGGGTPTHLSPGEIHRLFRAMTAAFPLRAGAEVSIEVDPRVTTEAHVEVLHECGFNRISLGVQDVDARVQEAIHRIQPVAVTAALVDRARKAGFGSVSFDLIYGLPFQTLASFERTLDEVIALAPDRIALYSYAHVTWVAKQQRGFERHDLPDAPTKLAIFLLALRRLLAAGFVHVGMDHFARPDDELAVAAREKTLRRNFMGYTTKAGLELLAFGPSGISELPRDYAQSEREIDDWDAAVRAGRLPTLRGHRLTDDDVARRAAIWGVMCQGRIAARDVPLADPAQLAGFEADGLLARQPDGGLRVTPLGRILVRNVAMAFDAYLQAPAADAAPRFSKTI